MPKIIADLEENILKEARRVLLESGYDALTMRAVASGCGIAVGTVYNYFASKELLCARVMLRDWQQALDGMCEDISSAPDALLGLRCIFMRIDAFRRVFSPAWTEYAEAGHAAPLSGPYHDALIAQIAAAITSLLERFGCLHTPALPAFLAESLLSSAGRGKIDFDALAPIYARLL